MAMREGLQLQKGKDLCQGFWSKLTLSLLQAHISELATMEQAHSSEKKLFEQKNQ